MIKNLGGQYTVLYNDKCYKLTARKKVKPQKILVGDIVEFSPESNVIEQIYPRRTTLIRPAISNVTQMIIVIAPVPKPDLYLVDKLLVKCFELGITPVVCVNKSDISSQDFNNSIIMQYGKVCDINFISANSGKGIDDLRKLLANNLTVLAGQSAVGKSSILNRLCSKLVSKVGDLSTRISRGKNCTRHVTIYPLDNISLLADTPGFSCLDVFDMGAERLCNFYPEFRMFDENCKYRTCVHVVENCNICAVKRAVNNHEINNERYSRYVDLYQQIKSKERKYE